MDYREEASQNRRAKMAAVTDDGRAVMECRVTRVADGFLIRFLVPPGTIMPNVHVEQAVAGGGQPSPPPAAPAAAPAALLDAANKRNVDRMLALGMLKKIGALKPEHIVNNFDAGDIFWAVEQFKIQCVRKESGVWYPANPRAGTVAKSIHNVGAYITNMIRFRKK